MRRAAATFLILACLLFACPLSDAKRSRKPQQPPHDDIVAQVQHLAKKLHKSVGQFLHDITGDQHGGAHKCANDLQDALGAKEKVETELHDCEVKLSAQMLKELTKTEAMETKFKGKEAGLQKQVKGLTSEVARQTAANEALTLRANKCERECSVQEEPAVSACSCTCPDSSSSSSSHSRAHSTSQSGGEGRARKGQSVRAEDATFTHMARVEKELAEAQRLLEELRSGHQAQALELAAALVAQRSAEKRADEAQAALVATEASAKEGACRRDQEGGATGDLDKKRRDMQRWLRENEQGRAAKAAEQEEGPGARMPGIDWEKLRDEKLKEFEAFRHDVVSYGEKVKNVLLGLPLSDALFGHGLRDPKKQEPSPECAALAERLAASEERNDRLGALLQEAEKQQRKDVEGRGLARLVDRLAELIPRLLSILICLVGATTLALLGLLLILGMLIINRLVLQRLVGSVGDCSLLDLCLECWGVLRRAAGQSPSSVAGAAKLLGAAHRLVRVESKLAAWQHRAAAPEGAGDAHARARGKVESLERRREGIVAELFALLEQRPPPPTPPPASEGPAEARTPSAGSMSLRSASSQQSASSQRSTLSDTEHVEVHDTLSCEGCEEAEPLSAGSARPQKRTAAGLGDTSRDALFPMRAESKIAQGGGGEECKESDEALSAIDAMQDALRATFPTLTEATDCFSDNTSMEAHSQHGDWEVVSNEGERAKEEEELDISVV